MRTLIACVTVAMLSVACGQTTHGSGADATAAEVSVADRADVPSPDDAAVPLDAVEADAVEADVVEADVVEADAVELDAGADLPDVGAPMAVADGDLIVADVRFPVFDGGVDAVMDTPPPTADVPTDAAPDARAPGLRELPPLPRYSQGTCPMLRGGPTSDTSVVTGFRTGGVTRSFRLLVPRSYDGSQDYPLVFAWHWLNASSGSFVRQGELETAVEQMRFIAVLPDSQSSYVFDWPFAEFWGIPAELQFFDDLYACVNQRFRIDRRRVHGIGVSAGGLWLTYLSTTDRANYFGSIEVLSGGLGEVPFAWRMAYTPQVNKFPAMVLWGGPTDFLGVNFDQASRRLRDELVRDQHFVVQCVHSMGHALPPISAPPGGGTRFRALWQFFLDHPFGSEPGTSPYFTTGLPADMPSWCAIASPRR